MQDGPGRARTVDLATGRAIPDHEWNATDTVAAIEEAGLTPICEVIYSKRKPTNTSLAVDAVMATLSSAPLNRAVNTFLDADGVVDQVLLMAPVSLPEDCWALVHVLPVMVSPRAVLAPPEAMLGTVRDFKVGSEPVGSSTRHAVERLIADGERALLLAVTSGQRGHFPAGIVAGVWQVAAMEDRGETVRVHALGGADEEAIRTRLRWGQLHVDGEPWDPRTAGTRGLWLPHTPQ